MNHAIQRAASLGSRLKEATRTSYSRLDWLLHGARRPQYVLARWMFLRLLGVIYLVAFVSLGKQIIGLAGENGILPAGQFLDAVYERLGPEAYYQFPTVCWYSASDTALVWLCWGGAALSVLLILGVAPVPVLILLWALYLSLSIVCQLFLGFQWDVLLLEAGVLAVFFAPMQLLPRLSRERRPSNVIRWLLWALLFKLMFLSGITKILSQDATWADWTALMYHYETQPIPTWTAWYAHRLPEWFQKMSVGGMYFIELVVPFFIFVPPRLLVLRRAACGLMIFLMLLIAATGNYGFFNWLAIALCLLLLDDAVWRRVLPWWLAGPEEAEATHRREGIVKRVMVAVVALVVLPMTSLVFVREIVTTGPQSRAGPPPMAWSNSVLEWIAPFRSINGYGLFRVMTTTRPEIVIEGSRDGVTWLEYEFRWKPGDIARQPEFIAPHQPRLDWQMWFAALNPRRAQGWLSQLIRRLLEGSPEVLNLLDENPFPDAPPRFIRLAYYEYHFTSREPPEARTTWWTRARQVNLTGNLSLPREP